MMPGMELPQPWVPIADGWRAQTLGRLTAQWRWFIEATDRDRDLFGDPLEAVAAVEARRVCVELREAYELVKELRGWLQEFDEPETVLEMYPAMRPFVAMGMRDGIRRPWRVTQARMPRAVEKWLPMVSIWAAEQQREKLRWYPYTQSHETASWPMTVLKEIKP